MNHHPLCPTQRQGDLAPWCFCPMLEAARDHERSRILTELDALHPICAEPSVTFTRQGCTCANGINIARQMVQGQP